MTHRHALLEIPKFNFKLNKVPKQRRAGGGLRQAHPGPRDCDHQPANSQTDGQNSRYNMIMLRVTGRLSGQVTVRVYQP